MHLTCVHGAERVTSDVSSGLRESRRTGIGRQVDRCRPERVLTKGGLRRTGWVRAVSVSPTRHYTLWAVLPPGALGAGLEPALAEWLAFSLPRGQPRFTGRVEREVTKLPVIQDREPGRPPASAVSFCRLRAIGWRPGPWPAQGAVPGTGGDYLRGLATLSRPSSTS